MDALEKRPWERRRVSIDLSPAMGRDDVVARIDSVVASPPGLRIRVVDHTAAVVVLEIAGGAARDRYQIGIRWLVGQSQMLEARVDLVVLPPAVMWPPMAVGSSRAGKPVVIARLHQGAIAASADTGDLTVTVSLISGKGPLVPSGEAGEPAVTASLLNSQVRGPIAGSGEAGEPTVTVLLGRSARWTPDGP